MRHALKTISVVVTVAGTMLAATTGCGTSDDSSSSPITIGALASLTGNDGFPAEDATKTAQAVFDRVNKQGGVNGRKIQFVVKDDATNPGRASQAARELLAQGAVAFAGDATIVGCAVNSAYYKQQSLAVVSAVGVDPVCFNSPNIASVNVGPFTSITANLYFASETLGHSKLCNFVQLTPGGQAAYTAAVTRWEKATGKKITINDDSIQPSSDLTPYLLRAKSAGCEAVVFNAAQPQVVPMVKIAKAQGMQNVDFLFLGVSYTEGVARALADLKDMKVYAGSEFEPYTDDTEANKDWRSLAESIGVAGSSFSQGGYVAAQTMVEVLKTIKGDITRESVMAALKSLKPVSNPMTGTPFTWGDATSHAPNQAVKMVKLEDGGWKTVTPDFVVVPGADG